METKISKNCWTIDGQSTDNRRTIDGQSTDIRRTTDGHVTDNGRTCDGHVTDMCATSTGKMRYFARIAAMLLMLLTMSVGEVWAIGFKKGNVFFDATGWDRPSYVALAVGKDSYTSLYQLDHIEHTQLYGKWCDNGNWWDGCNYFAVMGNSSSWSGGSWGYSNISRNASYYTSKFTGSYDIDNGTYLITKSPDQAKGGTFAIEYKGNPNEWNSTQSLKIQVSYNGSDWVNLETPPATLKITSYKFDGTNWYSVAENQKTATGYQTDVTAARTATTTVSCTNVNSDFVFVGWYDGGGVMLSNESSYTYYPQSAQSVYARFKKRHTVTFNANGHGEAPASQIILAGGKVSTPSDLGADNGYVFCGWYKEQGCTNRWDFANDIVTGDVTLYAKWVQCKLHFNDGSWRDPVLMSQEGKTFSYYIECWHDGDYEFNIQDGNNGNADLYDFSNTQGHANISQWDFGNNCKISLSRASAVTVTVTCTSDGSLPTLNATIEPLTLYVSGKMDNWQMNEMSYDEGSKTYSVTLKDVPANTGGDTYDFAIKYIYNEQDKGIYWYDSPNVSVEGSPVALSGLEYAGHRNFNFSISALSDLTITIRLENGKKYVRVSAAKRYRIRFLNADGTVLQDTQVEENTMPVYNGSTPTKAADAEFTYAFAGWDKTIVNATENIDYTATYTPTRVPYTLTWDLTGGNITTPGTAAGSVANASTLTAPVVEKTGYTFAGWSPAVPTNMPAENATYTATWTENKYDVTVNCNIPAGATLKFGDESKDWGSVASVGIDTKQAITVTLLPGYQYDGAFSVTGGAHASGAGSSFTIWADGADGVVTVNLAEDLTTGWKLQGPTTNTGAWPESAEFMKKTGESAGTVGYVEKELAASTTYYIQISNNGTWYGNKGTITGSVDNWTFDDTSYGANCTLKTTVAGTYIFKLDYSTKKVSVTYPTSYTVTFGQGTVKGGGQNAVTATGGIKTGDRVLSGTEITFTRPEPITGYTFEGWFDNQAGTGETLGTEATYVKTIDADFTIYAVYSQNLYPVTISAGQHGTVSPSGEQSVGVEGVNVTATPASHYYFNNWTTTDGASVASTTATTTKVTATAEGTVTANFTPSWSVRGSFNSWAEGNYIEHYEGNTGYVDIELSLGTYQFKVFHHDGGAYGNNGTMNRENCSGWTMATDQSNCQITTDKAGTYRFSFDVSTKKLSVIYPAPDPTLSIEASAAAGTFYTGQTITFTPTTNQKGDLTLCWTCVSKPGEAAAPVFTPVAESAKVTTSLDKAGEYVFSATIGRGECGSGEYELLATAPNCTIQVADVPYVLKVWYNGVGVTGEAIPFVNGEAAVTLAAGKEYGFKLINNTTYYTNANAADAKPTMKQTECTNWTMNNTNGAYANTLLATTIAGTYTFRLTLDGADSRRISIVYPHDAKTPANLSANAVPAQNGDVMLQAYYWAHEGNTATKWQKYGSVQWADLNREAAELGDNFDLVWLAPSQATADYTGFIPTNYSVQANDWGTEAELKTLINSLHAKNVEVIADVVLNHSNPEHPDEYTGADPNWCTWQTQNFSEYGSFNPTWEWLAKGDEMFYAKKALMGDCGTKDNTNNKEDEFGFFANDKQYWWSEPEFNCTYARDWAHNNRNVREMSRAYLTWLRNEIGYDGFRYDFMKGFHGSHVLDYNRAAGATFAVSELFEGDAAKLKGYIETTSRQSYVFDFPAKYQIMNEGIRYGLYNKLLGSNNTTLSRDNTYKKYAVTFVDNHDSFHEGSNLCGSANEMPNTGNQVLQANAYILSMPGVPCVFYPHWHEYKDAIRMMIHARKAAGINSESSVTEENDGRDSYEHKMYYAKIQGTNGTVILKLGAQAQTAPGGYITAYSAANVGMYYQTDDADLVTPIVTTTTPSQEYFNQINVNLSARGATDASYTIYYTTDGTTPTTSSATYSGAIHVTANTTVKAIAVKSDNAAVKSEVLTLNYTKVADKLTLDVTGTLKVGNAATLTVSKLSPEKTKYTYTYQVQEPGSTGFKIVAIDGEMSHSYTLAGGGWYTFRVETTDAVGRTFSSEKRVQVESETYYLRHPFDNGTNWKNVAMQDNGDGTYMYLSDGANIFAGGDKALEETGIASKFYVANGAHVGTDPSKFNQEPENQYTWWAATGAAGEHKKIVDARSDKTDGNYVVWIYNAINDELKVYTPTDKIYRIQVTVGDKTYGSNIIYTAASAENISFYGATDASYEIQYMGAGVGEWTYLAAISKPTAITENDVYSGTVTITDQVVDSHGAVTTPATAAFSISKYTGEYIVTSLATTKLTNTMTKFTPEPGNYYDHYYVEWVDAADDNVKNTYATVGNSINANLANAIGNYTIKTGASVRYAYNPATNVFTRTHLAGSTSRERYVSAFGTNLYNTADPRAQLTSPSNGEIFSDASNWMYNVTVVAGGTSAASLDLAAQYGGAYTYLLTPSGLQDDEYMRQLRNDGAAFANSKYTVIYDYKENRVLSGWNPEGAEIAEKTNVSNVIVTRTNDGSTSEFTISAGQLIVTDKMITEFVITKDMWEGWEGSDEIEGDKTYKSMLFWISLPYECTVANIFGFNAPYAQSTGTTYEIQRYRGDLRDKGTAGSSSWRSIIKEAVMMPNQGYVLAVRLCASDFKTIDERSEVRFFFPSDRDVTLNSVETRNLKAYTTNASAIQQDWHVMSVPVMQSGRKMVETGKTAAPFEFVYRWTWADGGRWYEPIKIKENEDYFNFLPGHAYMVQGHGDLTWNYEKAGNGTELTAPRRANALTAKDFRMELVSGEEILDKTYVLYRSNGSREYEIGRDLEKILNPGRSMIYSELDQKLAAICLSDEDNTQIPLTVVANESGEYTLQLPAPVSGVEPLLYDAEEGTTTMLNHAGYTIELAAGTYEGRFYLGISKVPGISTEIDNTSAGQESNTIMKFIDQNDRLIILKGGKCYDAQGRLVK